MTYRNLLIEDHGAVRRIMINRPDKLNALNRDTIGELHAAFTAAGIDDQIRVVVLAGSGEKAFVAGADIGELATRSPLQAQALARCGPNRARLQRRELLRALELLGARRLDPQKVEGTRRGRRRIESYPALARAQLIETRPVAQVLHFEQQGIAVRRAIRAKNLRSLKALQRFLALDEQAQDIAQIEVGV